MDYKRRLSEIAVVMCGMDLNLSQQRIKTELM